MVRNYVCNSGTVQHTIFLVIRLNIAIVTSCNTLIAILNKFLIIKTSKWSEETALKRLLIKYEFFKLVVTF